MLNVRACNGFRSGEQFLFARHLDRVHGEGTAMELEQLSNTTKKFSSEELEALIDVYNRRLRKL